MAQFGQFSLFLSLIFSVAAAALFGLRGEREETMKSGTWLLGAAAIAAALSVLSLALLLLAHDYRVQYVFEYADRSMSTGYLLAAVWGGQHGSLLFWAALQTLFSGAAAFWSCRHEPLAGRIALPLLALYQAAFILMVIFISNPFAPGVSAHLSADGHGMNPLLRNPFMLAHPPTLFLGFVGFSIPMAFSAAALVTRERDDGWLARQRTWILIAWGFLSIGNLLGMVWAYEELGWGGYWGWDPVENASLMPWLTGTALLHAALAQKRRGIALNYSHLLIIATFALIIFGTFLTRSGIVQSVHSFSGSQTGPWLLALIATTAGTSSILLIRRARSFRSEVAVAFGSRDWMLLATNQLFIFATVLVGIATIWPAIAAFIFGQQTAIPPELYNRWMTPIGLLILLLMAVCTATPFRPTPKNSRRGLWILTGICTAGVVAFAVASGAGSPAQGLRGFMPVIAIAVITMASISLFGGLRRLILNPGRIRAGALLAHMAVVFLFAGFTGNAFISQEQFIAAPGETFFIRDYRLRFLGLRTDTTAEKNTIAADIHVRREQKDLGVYSPSRDFYHAHPNQPTSEVGIHRGIGEDLFLILGEVEPESGRAILRVLIHPMVFWVWLGGIALILAAFTALIPSGAIRRLVCPDTGSPSPWSGARAVAVGLAICALLLLWQGPAPAIAGSMFFGIILIGLSVARAAAALRSGSQQ